MKSRFAGKWIWISLALFICSSPLAALALNICFTCGKEIEGPGWTLTDELTGEKVMVCSNCLMTLPRCYLCGLPIKKGDEVALPDGRYLCARDAKAVVLDTNEASQICAQVEDDLDKLFERFTFFPTNVDIAMIDRLDVQSMYRQSGYDIESPSLMGCIRPVVDDDVHRRYDMKLMTGLPLASLKATCAHEYSHAWVGDNVSNERHHRIAGNAVEGFCELVAYLLMDSQHEEAQKKFILRNHYTRGQVQLFIEAEERFGFDEILDWMRYGVTSRLEEGHLDEIRDINIPTANSAIAPAAYHRHQFAGTNTNVSVHPPVVSTPTTVKLEGILWGNPPSAIINGKSFFAGDSGQIKLGGTNVLIHCLGIQPKSVRIQTGSGQEQELNLPQK